MPRWPREAFEALADAGALSATAPASGGERPPVSEEWGLVRAVARADGSVGRIYDGHLNAVDRLIVAAPRQVRDEDLALVAQGRLLLGVWGADPIPGEGEPATIERRGNNAFVTGVKVFCSGAGGVQRALVVVREKDPGPPTLAYVDVTSGVKVDTTWYKSSGMRASESHRVEFLDAPVVALLGERGELAREPHFGRDAMRTAASWAGVADTAFDAALATLAAKGEPDSLVAVAAGRMKTAQMTIDNWLAAAARRLERDPAAPTTELSIHVRDGIANSCRTIVDEAARACGSRPFATGDDLDRARRDLEVFLLQHRLEPLVARTGKSLIEGAR